MTESDPSSVLAYLIGKYSHGKDLTTGQGLADLARDVSDHLGLKAEVAQVKGMDYLSPPEIVRWTTAWRAWK